MQLTSGQKIFLIQKYFLPLGVADGAEQRLSVHRGLRDELELGAKLGATMKEVNETAGGQLGTPNLTPSFASH